MADEKSLKKYFENYSDSILRKVGSNFSYSAFVEKSRSKRIVPAGLVENFYEEAIDFPWLEEMEIVTEKIMSIASKPRTHIKVEKDVKKAEQAVKIDNYDVIETLKVPAYWKRKGDRFLPEKVFTDIFEIEYAIYENRFIINLVDKMMLFLSQVISQLYNQIRKINAHFIDFHVPLGDVELIQEIANYKAFNGLSKEQSRSKRLRDDKVTLLTTKDSPYVDALRRVLQSRANVGHIRSTPFYKDVKKAKPLSDTDVHLTNMLAGDSSYAPCYDFYRKLLPLLTKDIGMQGEVEPKSYHNFVVSNLLSAFNDTGFTDTTKRNTIKYKDDVIQLNRYCITKGVLDCYITTNDADHIELEFELKDEKFKGTYNLSSKRYSKVSLDLTPSFTAEYPNIEELCEYFRKKNLFRIGQGYTNSFVITPVDGTQNDNVMICSPRVYKIDANLRSMIESCTIFAECDGFIYSHVCPVCGFYVDGEQEDGNCYCTSCDSAYTLLKSKQDNDEISESVWIKRVKNPERI